MAQIMDCRQKNPEPGMDNADKQLVRRVLDKVMVNGVQYADLRIESSVGLSIRMAKGNSPEIEKILKKGYMVRVLYQGAWGFAAGQGRDEKAVEDTLTRALAMARAAAEFSPVKISLAPVEPVSAYYQTPIQKDPALVSLSDKVSLLESCFENIKGPHLIRATGILAENRVNKVFASSEGALIVQDLVECGGGISAFAAHEGEVQRRTYPGMVFGDIGSRGWEYVEGLDLVGNAPRLAQEAQDLLFAEACPLQKNKLILTPSMMAIQIHESAGHPTELDRVYGYERTLSGGTFLMPDKKGGFRYGSDLVNITADATAPGGRGTFGYDDEGVPAQKTPLVKNGIFQNYLSSRETAARLGVTPSGAARADAWNHIPLIRMTNINLEPGETSFEDMIADTDDGILMDSPRMWSIDSLRLNFQFGAEIAWEIKDGRKGKMLKNPTYGGITPEFWRKCDRVGDEKKWRLTGFACGKGEPLQFEISIGHGAPPTRFHDVQIGV